MSIVAQCVVAALSTVILICSAVALESTHPSSRRIANTVAFNTVCALLVGVWARILQPIASAEAGFLKTELGLTPLPLPEHGWPVWFSAVIVMLAADLIFYWVHRAQHRYDFLWAMHYNTNFCGAFPIWDLVFGTYRAPAAGEFPETGVASTTSRPRPLHALLWPLYSPSSQDEQSVE